MADQSSGTPRPLGARPFARPHTGPTGAAQPRDAKTTPARPALPPFAPAALAVPQGFAGVEERAAPMPEAVALLHEDRSPEPSLMTEAVSEPVPPNVVEVPVAADAIVHESSEPQWGRDELPNGDASVPVLPSSEMWTPEWTPVVVPNVTNPDGVAETSAIAEEASAIEKESESAARKLPEQEIVVAADPVSWMSQEEESVPLFRDLETEPEAPSHRSAPLGHWTDAPSAEGVRASNHETLEPQSYVDAGTSAPTMDDVSGSLDDSPVAMTAQPALGVDQKGIVGPEAPPLMDVVPADSSTVSKERQYADVLEAVASRVRAGEIQLPVTPGADDEAAILAAVLASLLSSR